MSRHPNLDLLERGHAAFRAHDLAALGELFDPALVWHHEGESILAGDYRGLDDVFAYFARRDALTGATYSTEPLSSSATDSFVTVYSRARAERDGRVLEDEFCSIYRVERGRLVEAWTIPAHAAIERAFYED